MTVYNFPLDLTKTYPILEDTEVVLSGDVSSNSVQDVLLNLLPEPSEIKDTPVSLKIVTVSITTALHIGTSYSNVLKDMILLI